jgi:hypothetical protein
MHPQQKMIDGFRQLADFLEANPAPGCIKGMFWETWNLFVNSKEEMAEAARWLGSCDKHTKGNWFCLTRKFGNISAEVNIEHERVCERVKVGERVVPARPERVLPAEPEKVEEVYEWKCPESILRPNEPTEAEIQSALDFGKTAEQHVCEPGCPAF